MFHLELQHFAGWVNYSLSLNVSDRLVLIKGSSGSGKSLLFEAITWCLWGHRRVAPRTNPKAKTIVTLTLPNIRVSRERIPNILRVSYQGQDYTDQAAQNIIINIFGSYSLYQASSYISQGVRNQFLVSTSNERLQLLNELAFAGEDVEPYIRKIEEALEVVEKEYNGRLIQYQEEYKRYEPPSVVPLTPEEENLLHTEIRTLKDIYPTLQHNSLTQPRIQQELQQLRALLSKKKKPTLPDDIPSDYEELIPLYKRYLPLLRTREQLEDKEKHIRERMSNYLPLSQEYSEEDYISALQTEALYNQEEPKVRELCIPYDEESIRKKKNEYQTLLDQQVQVRLAQSYQQQLDKINSYEEQLSSLSIEEVQPLPTPITPSIQPPSIVSSETKRLREELQQLQVPSQSLSCPSCQDSLIYIDGRLVKDEESRTKRIKDLEVELTNLQEQYTHAYRAYQVKRQEEDDLYHQNIRECERIQRFNHKIIRDRTTHAIISTQLSKAREVLRGMKLPSLTTKISNINEKKISSSLYLLNSLRIIIKPSPSSNEIRKQLIWQKDKSKYEIIIQNINALNQQLPRDLQYSEVNRRLGVLENYKKELDSYQQLSSSLNSRIQQLQSEVKEGDWNQQVLNNNARRKEIKNHLILSDQALIRTSQLEKLEIQHSELLSVYAKIEVLQSLKEIAINTEHQVLTNTVNNLNSSLGELCSLIFEQQLSVSFNLYKEIKKTHYQKPSITLMITHQGNTFEQLNEISGGQKDRVSIAVLLAITQLRRSPFIILDETLCSSGSLYAEMILKVLLEYFDGWIFITLPDSNEALYSRVIDVEEY